VRARRKDPRTGRGAACDCWCPPGSWSRPVSGSDWTPPTRLRPPGARRCLAAGRRPVSHTPGARRMTPEGLIAAALAVPLAGAAGIALARRSPEPARETVNPRHRRSPCSPAWLGCLPGVLAGERPLLLLFDMLPGIALAFRVRAARHAVRHSPPRGCGSSTRSTRSATCARTGSTTRRASTSASRWRWQPPWGSPSPPNLLSLFLCYEALTLVTYPLVTHRGRRRGAARRAHLPCLPARHLDRAALAGHHRKPGRSPERWNSSPAGNPGRRAFGRRARRPARAVHVRHRQGGADAVPPLAAGRDGGACAVSALLHAVAVVKAGVFTV